MKIEVKRDVLTPDGTLGKMYVDDSMFGYTCEDTDRKLEDGGEKIQNETAIPRGTYRVVTSFSHHFGKVMPEILDVPGFVGVRIHGGNSPADTEGCILLGRVRTAEGVANCSERNSSLMNLLTIAEEARENIWLTVS